MMYIRHEKITVRPSKRRKCKTHPLAERIAEMCMNMIRQELPDFRAHLELLIQMLSMIRVVNIAIAPIFCLVVPIVAIKSHSPLLVRAEVVRMVSDGVRWASVSSIKTLISIPVS
jgi:hypothetical protein